MKKQKFEKPFQVRKFAALCKVFVFCANSDMYQLFDCLNVRLVEKPRGRQN